MSLEELSGFSDDEFEEELKDITKDLLRKPFLRVCGEPRAFLLGGQSGAGKTNLHKVLADELEKNVIVINGDEYRSLHPRFSQLDAQYGPEAVTHTAAWAGQMVEALVAGLSSMRYNLVVEGTLRTSQVPLDTAALLRGKGYRVSLALMAVKPEVSLVSCQIRYELMRMAGTTPRATDPAHHNKIVADIVQNVGVLESSGLFDEIRLYSREREQLYPVEGDARRAADVLEAVLFGPWTLTEREHYEFLEAKRASLQGGASLPSGRP